jgi:hypothetical protein
VATCVVSAFRVLRRLSGLCGDQSDRIADPECDDCQRN